KVKSIVRSKGYIIANIDSIIVAQKPRISPYVDEMKANIADLLQLDKDCIGIKATTPEGLGFTGRGEGIAAYAVVCIYK
nr:2-C-methyl-D-erythritol 2,4-cyclodiphosphate synthase [Bacillota bacterium]